MDKNDKPKHFRECKLKVKFSFKILSCQQIYEQKYKHWYECTFHNKEINHPNLYVVLGFIRVSIFEQKQKDTHKKDKLFTTLKLKETLVKTTKWNKWFSIYFPLSFWQLKFKNLLPFTNTHGLTHCRCLCRALSHSLYIFQSYRQKLTNIHVIYIYQNLQTL